MCLLNDIDVDKDTGQDNREKVKIGPICNRYVIFVIVMC